MMIEIMKLFNATDCAFILNKQGATLKAQHFLGGALAKQCLRITHQHHKVRNLVAAPITSTVC